MSRKCCNAYQIGGSYRFHLDGDENIAVYADESRVDQIVVNLINKAIKYAPNNKDIYLSYEGPATW